MDHHAVFERLEERIEQIGYEVETYDVQTVELDNDTDSEGITTYGIIAGGQNGPEFAFICDDRSEYVEVQSNYNLWGDVAERLTEAQIEDILDDTTPEVPEDHAVRDLPLEVDELEEDQVPELKAAVAILSRLDDETYDEIIYHLTDIFTSAETKHVVDALEARNSIIGFKAFHKIFPQEDNFDRHRLNDAVEQVRMSRHRAEVFLRYSFGMDIDQKDHSRMDPSPEVGTPDNSLQPQ